MYVFYIAGRIISCEGVLENGRTAGQIHQRSPSTFKCNARKTATPGYLYLQYQVTPRDRVEVAGLEGNPVALEAPMVPKILKAGSELRNTVTFSIFLSHHVRITGHMIRSSWGAAHEV